MARFTIPKDHLTGFDTLCEITDDTFKKIGPALEKTQVAITPEPFQKELVEILEVSGAHQLGAVLFAIAGVLNNAGEEDLETLANDLIKSVDEKRSTKFRSDKKRKLLERLISVLPKLTKLQVTHKAYSLYSDNEKSLISTRILTDIRLIFNEDIKDKNRYALVTHLLKIKYNRSEKDCHFFVNLDIDDLEELQKQVQRAIEKEKLIRSNYDKSISFVEIK